MRSGDGTTVRVVYPFRSTPEGLQGIIPLFHQLKNPLYYSILLHLAVK